MPGTVGSALKRALVIGAGPAGLMAADVMAARGLEVTLCEAKPSAGRKLLMAGKSGLNLTKDEPFDALLPNYTEAASFLHPILQTFDAINVQIWARSLGQEVFVGSTGRVFPTSMKASPLLRSWLARLESLGVTVRTRMYWRGWDTSGTAVFDAPAGQISVETDVTVLALGGASWTRLGSDGKWVEVMASQGVILTPFAPANVGLRVQWSKAMSRVRGRALKGVALQSGQYRSRGEAIISVAGLEGGGVYEVCRGIREGGPLIIDLLPDLSVGKVTEKLARPIGKTSMSTHLRKTLKLDPVKIALAQECARPLPKAPDALAAVLKALVLPHQGLRPMNEAISTAGGVPFEALTDQLMLKARPGVFCAGEMLDWEAPTGGYLITGCLATGRWAGSAAADYLENAT